MSAHEVGWVFRHSPTTGAAFAVHLAIADSVNDQNDYELWMRLPNLARKARLSEGACRKVVKQLIAGGLLEVTDDGRSSDDVQGVSRPRRFRFLMPDLPLVYGSEGRAVGATGSRLKRDGSRPGRGRSLSQGRSQAKRAPDGALPGLDDPQSDPQPVDAARDLIARVWEARSPRPAAPFIALVQIARQLLDAGHAVEAVEGAFMRSRSFTVNALEFELNGGRQNGRPLNNVTDSGPAREAWDVEGAFFNGQEAH